MKPSAVLPLGIALLVALLAGAGTATGPPRRLATIRGQEPDEHLGRSMAAAGDVNGDGLADLLVGDSRDGWLPGERRCYLYRGRSVLDTVPDLVIPQFEADTLFPHEDDDDRFGAVVSGGCDVNGDGFDDILITSPDWFMYTGKVYLYHGAAAVDTVPDVAIAACGSSWMTFFWATELRGRLLEDVDGDGYGELACLVGDVTPDAGAHVYDGGAPMDSVHDLSLRGPGFPEFELGRDMADGDLNGDGYGDIVVTCYNLQEADAAWVYSGGTAMDSTPDLRLPGFGWPTVCVPGDMNGDGFAEAVLVWGWYAQIYFGATQMDSLAGMAFWGESGYGPMQISGGDLNRDGYADLLVGQGGEETGRAAVYLGGPDYVPGASEPDPDFEITGPDEFGDVVAFLGDMTGDGWPEFAVSDPKGPGAIYIYTLAPEHASEEPPHNAVLSGLRLVPNPTAGPVTISYWMCGPGNVNVGVYDLTGRLVRELFSGPGGTGLTDVWWDGTNAEGRQVPAGVYVVEVRATRADSPPGAAGLQGARVVLTQ
jgi:hypothetical protein